VDIILICRRLARKVDHFIAVLEKRILKYEDESVLFSRTMYNVSDDRIF